jgi:phage tail sheath protein FI
MPQILPVGSYNRAAQVVPDITVGTVEPQNLTPQGVPTDTLGVVGTASFGPVNRPVVVGDLGEFAAYFGKLTTRKHDAGTVVLAGVLQGSDDFRIVRVTDGTDVAASIALSSDQLAAAPSFWTALAAAINAGQGVIRAQSQLVSFDATAGLFHALYTGTGGNGIVVAITGGAKANTFRVVVRMGSATPEVYEGIPAAVGHLPALAAYALAGGTDGADGITSAQLVGTDADPRTGIYSLRGQGCSVVLIADMDDSTQWTTIDGFASTEATYAVNQIPLGTSISDAIALKQASGLDSRYSKLLHGDGVFINDTTNGVIRATSPASFAAGKLVALSPEESPLNKPLNGIVGSQKSGLVGSGAQLTYSRADLQALFAAGIDVICNPQPGGRYWGVRLGHNTSSNPAVHGDAGTRTNNFLSTSIANTMGIYVGLPISYELLDNIAASLRNMLANFLAQGILGSVNPLVTPYVVICDLSNNPDALTGNGFVKASVQVRTMAINENFEIDLEDGPTVTLASQAA